MMGRWSTSAAVGKLRDQGDKALREGDAVRALIAYGLGRMYLMKKDPVKEREEYLQAVKIDPRNVEGRVALGDAYLHDGQVAEDPAKRKESWEQAVVQYNAALAQAPNNTEAHAGLAT